MKPFSLLPLVLALACNGLPESDPGFAPEAEASLEAKTLTQRTAALERQNRLLYEQLQTALTQIAALDARATEAEAATQALRDSAKQHAGLLQELDGAVHLVDPSTGDKLNRVEALEGAVLEVEPITGEIKSQLRDLSGGSYDGMHYNKIKWTYATHRRTVGELVGDHEAAVFEIDRETQQRVNKIDAITIKQKVTERTLEELTLVDDIFDAGFEGTCGESLKKHIGNVKYEEISFKCGTGMRSIAVLEDDAKATDAALANLVKVDGGLGDQIASLVVTDAGLLKELSALNAAVCELTATTAHTLRGRWDGEYDEGSQPGFWTGLSIDTLDGEVSWESWVDRNFVDDGSCPAP